MIHLADMTWVQSLLIELGVLFQLIAIGAFIRETSADRALMRSREKRVYADQDADQQVSEYQMSDQSEHTQADPTPRKSFEEHPHPEIKAGNLTRTAKVKFVQTFKFRS